MIQTGSNYVRIANTEYLNIHNWFNIYISLVGRNGQRYRISENPAGSYEGFIVGTERVASGNVKNTKQFNATTVTINYSWANSQSGTVTAGSSRQMVTDGDYEVLGTYSKNLSPPNSSHLGWIGYPDGMIGVKNFSGTGTYYNTLTINSVLVGGQSKPISFVVF